MCACACVCMRVHAWGAAGQPRGACCWCTCVGHACACVCVRVHAWGAAGATPSPAGHSFPQAVCTGGTCVCHANSSVSAGHDVRFAYLGANSRRTEPRAAPEPRRPPHKGRRLLRRRPTGGGRWFLRRARERLTFAAFWDCLAQGPECPEGNREGPDRTGRAVTCPCRAQRPVRME